MEGQLETGETSSHLAGILIHTLEYLSLPICQVSGLFNFRHQIFRFLFLINSVALFYVACFEFIEFALSVLFWSFVLHVNYIHF